MDHHMIIHQTDEMVVIDIHDTPIAIPAPTRLHRIKKKISANKVLIASNLATALITGTITLLIHFVRIP